MNLFHELENISELIPVDFGGGSSLSKTYLMAYLVLKNNLKIYAEIGVYKGRSLFPIAYAIKQNNGVSYGIDPYIKDAAREHDVEKNLEIQIDEFIDKLDFEGVYQEVLELRSQLDLENHIELLRKKSSDSVDFFKKNNIKIDIIHIDGNHDTKYVTEDVELYLPLINHNGFIIMDDIDWDSVKPAYKKLKESTTVIFESADFAILINSKIKNEVKGYEFELYNIFDIIQAFIEQKSVIKEKNKIIKELRHRSSKEANSDDFKSSSQSNKIKLPKNKFTKALINKKLNSNFIQLISKFIIPLKTVLYDNYHEDYQDIIILDDLFPHPLSAFRLQEYNSYLEYFNKIKIYSYPLSFPALKENRSIETIIKNYVKENPQFKHKVKKFDFRRFLHAKLIYTIFLNNAFFYIDTIEKYNIPFVFTLYPGGGFELNDKISDKKLKRVLSSPCFRKVIVTQKITYDYLVDNNFCKEDKIEEIFGIVTSLDLLDRDYNDKKYFGKDKSKLDICFVAHRYTENGIDKGYDVFIEVAHELAQRYDNIHFHIVGSFDKNILDVTQIRDKINFYGTKVSKWFNEFYKDKDIILSPNIPFKMFKGHFDGFPTGCCTDAGLHKVAIFCTDQLNLNTLYDNEKDIVIIPHDTGKIVEIIEKYYHNPEKLQKIAEAGYLKIKEIYNYENQIASRIKILEELIK
ncbi:class I SAM-dependent methyltransferase [Methanobacterium sp.]|uniref:class I SAM-dependent methyltransferase n=1 Tax=Methanobacterium sp. TaxID=2164 RepID=UPI003C789E83